jgi:hypothetical protein
MGAQGYARNTDVPVERTRAEIDSVLTRNGATSVAILNDEDRSLAAFAFTLRGARFRVQLPLPTPEDVSPKAGGEPQGWRGWDEPRRAAWRGAALRQARMQRWRQMLLLLKAKLEIVRMGLSSVEHEFMADMVLPSGETAGQVLSEAIRRGLGGTGDIVKMLGR